MALETRLKPTWDWILTVMDATEAQLRFGASLTHTTDPSHPLHPLHLNSSQPIQTTSSSLSGLNVLGGASQSRTRLIDPSANGHGSSANRIVGFASNPENPRGFERDSFAQSSRREFLTYALSLMRSHSSEHRDSLPVLDITALRHIAYVLDGIVFYMRSGKDNDDKPESNYWTDPDENENDDTEEELQMGCDNDSIDDELLPSVPGSRHTFFQRSESTLCLGCPPPEPFNTPMNEALPLADQPHLLQPNACREDLFGIPKQPITIPSNNIDPPGFNSPLELPPTRLGLSLSQHRPTPLNMVTSHYESNFSYIENSNDTPTQEDQTSEDVDEKTEKVRVAHDEVGGERKRPIKTTPSISGTSSASNSDEVLPSTSKIPELQSTRRQPENFNLYVQLKKKTYFDFHDDENKSNAEIEKRDEGPQDLSCSKSNTDSNNSKMEIESDNEIESDLESDVKSRQSVEHPAHQINDNATAGASNTVRPQIIVTPRKIAAAIESVRADILAKHNKTHLAECIPLRETSVSLLPASFNNFVRDHTDASRSGVQSMETESSSNTVNQGSTNSTSPSKSVIVRAGPSVS